MRKTEYMAYFGRALGARLISVPAFTGMNQECVIESSA